MPAYVVAQIDVRDPVQYETYKRLAERSIGQFGGRYLTRGGAVEVLEGQWAPRRYVILDFPDMATARAWYASPAYAEAAAVRRACSEAVLLLAEALPEPFAPGPGHEG